MCVREVMLTEYGADSITEFGDTMAELAQGESEDTHQAAYDEPDITHESPERVDEAQQVLEDEGDHSAEAQYVRERNANQIEELGTLFEDFTAAVSLAAGKAAIRTWHPPTADPLIP